MKSDTTVKSNRLSDYIGEGDRHPARVYIDSMASSAWRYCLEQGMQAFVGWIPTAIGVAVRALFYRLLLNRRSVDTLYTEGGADIRWFDHIVCGKRIFVDRNVRVHASIAGIEIGDNTKVFFGSYLCSYTSDMAPGEGIHIGKNCWIGVNAVLHGGRGGIWIGDCTLLAPNVTVVCGNHELVRRDAAVDVYEQKPVHIGKNCWIGAGSTVLGGVTLGDNVTVAAGAVVISSFPSNVVLGGVPAKVIKELPEGGAR